MAANKSSKLGLGVLLGAAAGAVAGLFLAPKAGKELRSDAKKLSKSLSKSASIYRNKLDKKTSEEIAKIVFGDVSEASMKLADIAHKELTAELKNLEKQYKTIDKDKYAMAVKSVIANLKKDGKVPAAPLKKLASYLQDDVKKLTKRPAAKKAAVKSAKKSA